MIRLLPLALLLLAAPAHAQSGGHAQHGSAAAAAEAASTTAFRAANDAMHAGMAIDFTGDADRDFILGMIAHHDGAVAMARIVLAHGRDPEVRTLAEAILVAQTAEIAFMQDWLARTAR